MSKIVLDKPLEEELQIETPQLPIVPRLRHSLSGLYLWSQPRLGPVPEFQPEISEVPEFRSSATVPETELNGVPEVPKPVLPVLFARQELRLDIDGFYPQLVASGTSFRGGTTVVHWIAKLERFTDRPNHFVGAIWYKDPANAVFPFNRVDIQVNPGFTLSLDTAAVIFSGPVIRPATFVFKHKSAFFHTMNFEYDFQEGITPDVCYDTSTHPNHPASLPHEKLTVETVYRRAGFDVSTTPGDRVPIAGAGLNSQWSNQEMHDAMQVYWSHFANAPQWAAWAFFAGQHEMGSSLGGIMFDSTGAYQRQGTAIFYNSFISQPPSNDPNPAAYVERMKFWTGVHELGHTFNLAHSWQKALGVSWIPLQNEPAALSFMNYPYLYPGTPTPSEQAFWANFEFRFTNNELLFMRHAPGKFVEQGFAAWFDHHGFEQANVSPDSALKLEVRTNRSTPIFQFMEPAMLELKLTNSSAQPVLLPEDTLQSVESMTIIIKKDGQPARQFRPFAQYCRKAVKRVLNPQESLYDSLFIASGLNGWQISEPGFYTVQVALHMEEQDIVSNPLRLRVATPLGFEQEFLAQDFFSEEVGRILTFDGSRFLKKGNDTLREVAEKLKDQNVAIHARVALGMTDAREVKSLEFKAPAGRFASAGLSGASIACKRPDLDAARKEFAGILKRPGLAAESLGHVDFKYYIDRFTDFLAFEGASKEAIGLQDQLLQTLADRKVLERVLEDIRLRREQLEGKGIRTMKAAS